MVTSSKIRWARFVFCMEIRNVYKILIGISELKRPLRRPRSFGSGFKVVDEFIWLRAGTVGALL